MEHNTEMVVDHVQRITQLEDRVKVMEGLTAEISGTLTKVTQEISAIKWLTAGGVGVFILNEFGLLELIKLMLS